MDSRNNNGCRGFLPITMIINVIKAGVAGNRGGKRYHNDHDGRLRVPEIKRWSEIK